MIKFNPEKFTAMVENEFSRATHVFKSTKDAEAFARDMLDELANRLVTITITVCGQKVVQSGITYDKAMRLKEKFVDAVISEVWEPEWITDADRICEKFGIGKMTIGQKRGASLENAIDYFGRSPLEFAEKIKARSEKPKKYGFFLSGERVMWLDEFETIEAATPAISEAWECHFRNDSLKRNYREGTQEYFCRLCPEKSCPETEMFSCECGWAGPETDLCRKYPKNWPEKQFITEEYACPKCCSFGVEEIEECKPTDEMIENLYVGDFVLVDFRPGKEIVKIDGACSYSRLNGWDFNKNRQPFNQDDILSIRQSEKCWNRRESKTAFDPEPGERVRLKGMSHAVLILGKKTSWNPMKVKYVGYYWLIDDMRSFSFGPDDIVEIV